jgi:hypothetical protein
VNCGAQIVRFVMRGHSRPEDGVAALAYAAHSSKKNFDEDGSPDQARR